MDRWMRKNRWMRKSGKTNEEITGKKGGEKEPN